MFEMLITSLFSVSALMSSTLLFKMLHENKKLHQLDFPDLENEIADLRLEYERVKKFRALSHERDALKKAIDVLYEDKSSRHVSTQDLINKVESNRESLNRTLPRLQSDLNKRSIENSYRAIIESFITRYHDSKGTHLLKLPIDEHDTSHDIIREVIRSYDCIKEHSYYAFSYLNGSKGIETGAYYTLRMEIKGGSECESQRSIT
ncbi:hypothetical protein [Macrococcus armenti]|uniref:hypothetical protein n=1 Tax=Macrococcus armenti TaxID=2875764 RepID=UPI001CD6968B|nr:hypothetical protein [Macrococcus armenti]UBH10090.1 hypothetical protein LAU38_07330 [Macrococcus armenti]